MLKKTTYRNFLNILEALFFVIENIVRGLDNSKQLKGPCQEIFNPRFFFH
jgi:hypothetical protein